MYYRYRTSEMKYFQSQFFKKGYKYLKVMILIKPLNAELVLVYFSNQKSNSMQELRAMGLFPVELTKRS
jgi:hypothetical protein